MEFMIKHPIVSLLIVNEICSAVKSFADRCYVTSVVDDIPSHADDAFNAIRKGNEYKAKIGFRVA